MASASVKAHGFSALPAEVLTLIINRLDSDNVGLRALRAAYKHPAVSTETARKLFKDLILRVRFDAQETGHVRDPRGIGDVLKFVQSTTFVDNSRRAPPEDCCRQWELCYAVAWIKLRLPEHSIVALQIFDLVRLRWLLDQHECSLKSLEYSRFTQTDLICADFWSRPSITSFVCHQFHLEPKYGRDFQSFLLEHRSSLQSLTIGNDPRIAELSLQRLIGWPGIMNQVALDDTVAAFCGIRAPPELKLAPSENLPGLLFALAELFESLSPNEEVVRLKSFSVYLSGPVTGVAALRKFLMSFTGLRQLSILFGSVREDGNSPLEAGFFTVSHGTSLRSLVLDQRKENRLGRRSTPSVPHCFALGSCDDPKSVFWDVCHNCPGLEELSIPLPDVLDQRGFASGIANLKALRLLHRRTYTGFVRTPAAGGHDSSTLSAAWLRNTVASLSSHFIDSGQKPSL